MRNKFLCLLPGLLCLAPAIKTIAQDSTVQTIKRGPYTLTVINKDPSFDEGERQRLIETFFTVYPQEAKRFNPKTLRKVTFLIDPSYEGVAETDNGQCRYNPKWLTDHPEDIDVVTHEVMHIVQDYHHDNDPGWMRRCVTAAIRRNCG